MFKQTQMGALQGEMNNYSIYLLLFFLGDTLV